jgi:hypothetical protein
MNNKIIFTAVITAFIMLTTTSCKPKDPLKAKAEKFSEKFCECAGPSATFLDKMKNEQPEDVEALIAESEEIGKNMQDCMGEEYMDPFKDLVEEDKGKFDSLFQESVTKKCADIAKSFGI